jgi:hypothetical protein
MNVTEYLHQNGIETQKIIFQGEPFTAPNVAKLKNKMLHEIEG